MLPVKTNRSKSMASMSFSEGFTEKLIDAMDFELLRRIHGEARTIETESVGSTHEPPRRHAQFLGGVREVVVDGKRDLHGATGLNRPAVDNAVVPGGLRAGRIFRRRRRPPIA